MRNHCTSGLKSNRSYGHKVTVTSSPVALAVTNPRLTGQSRSHRHSFIPNRPKPPRTAATQMAHPCNRCPSAPKSPYNRTKCVWMRRQRYKYCESVDALTHFVRGEASQQHRRWNYKYLPLGVNKQNPTVDIAKPRRRPKRRRRDSVQITCPG